MCKFRFMLIVLSIAVVCTLAQGTAFAGVVAQWEFDNNLTDSSGNGHTGVPTNGDVSYVTDGGATALLLSSLGSYVTIPGSSDFQFSGDGGWTVELRAKLDAGAYNMLVDNSLVGGGGGSWWLRTKPGGQLQSDFYDGSGEREATSDLVAADSTWHQMAVVFDGTTDALTLYVDYTADGFIDYTNGVALTGAIGVSTDWLIGLNGYGNLSCSGAIDYIRISDAALSPSQFIGFVEPIPGDANNDGMVNETDAAALATNWLTQGTATWEMGDFNGDNNVDDIDAALLAANWQTGANAASVPEPGCIILLAGGIVVLLIRRR